jgi:replicative DNA helicase
MSERFVLPVDAEAERSVLAAALTAPYAFHELVEHITVGDFGVVAHQLIFDAMVAADAASRPVDPITVADELRRAKQLTRAGGVAYLDELVAQAGTSNPAHTDIIADKSLLRSLVATGRTIAADALAAETPAKELLETAEAKIFDLGRHRTGDSMMPMTQLVASTLPGLLSARSSLLLGHSTGLGELDEITSGLQGGQLVVIAGRPGAGKSAFGMQIASYIAKTTGKIVGAYTYEMSSEELVQRLLSAEIQYNLSKLRRGELVPGMERSLAVAAEKLASLPLYIDDNPPMTIAGVRSSARRLSRRGELGAIIIDYCQLMEADRKSRDPNRTQEIAEISRGAKRLASELDVPVLLLSQLSRSVESRPNKRPQLSDLRDSGSLEQDASLALFLYRDAMYNTEADATIAECIVAKQRNGPTGTVYMQFNPECASFASTTRRPAAGPSSAKKPGDPF